MIEQRDDSVGRGVDILYRRIAPSRLFQQFDDCRPAFVARGRPGVPGFSILPNHGAWFLEFPNLYRLAFVPLPDPLGKIGCNHHLEPFDGLGRRVQVEECEKRVVDVIELVVQSGPPGPAAPPRCGAFRTECLRPCAFCYRDEDDGVAVESSRTGRVMGLDRIPRSYEELSHERWTGRCLINAASPTPASRPGFGRSLRQRSPCLRAPRNV